MVLTDLEKVFKTGSFTINKFVFELDLKIIKNIDLLQVCI